MKEKKLVAPVVKWVGGKRQLLSDIKKYIPESFATYYEPFVGGGAVLFELEPKKAIVNDINEELINLYKVIKESPEELIKELKRHAEFATDAEYYYKIREKDRNIIKYMLMSDVEKAARIHFLNKTCYNGLFRVNKSGAFNVPFGRYKNPDVVNEVTIRAVSKYFNEADIEFRNTDFEEALQGIKKDDFVYLDPPYDPITHSSNFTGYSKGGFGRNEQERLKKMCDKLNKKGVKFLLSNSATDYIKDLYKDYKIEIIKAKRVINSNAALRGEIDEVLIRNYE